MIAYIKGKVIYKSSGLQKANFVVVEVGGVGYKVSVHTKIFDGLKTGSAAEIFTYHHISENDMELFGFLSFEQVEFFKMLVGISGIGPKSAMNIMEKTKVEDIQRAVMADKPELLSGMGGVTKRTAEKIVLALKGNVKSFPKVSNEESESLNDDLAVFEALEALGFDSDQARDAISRIPQDLQDKETRIKEALKILGTS